MQSKASVDDSMISIGLALHEQDACISDKENAASSTKAQQRLESTMIKFEIAYLDV